MLDSLEDGHDNTVQQGSRCLGGALDALKMMNVDMALRMEQGALRCLGGTMDALKTMNVDVVLRMEQGALKENAVREQGLESACRNSSCVCELR